MSESSDEYGVGFISPRKITFGPKLGEGSFGEVFKGEIFIIYLFYHT